MPLFRTRSGYTTTCKASATTRPSPSWTVPGEGIIDFHRTRRSCRSRPGLGRKNRSLFLRTLDGVVGKPETIIRANSIGVTGRRERRWISAGATPTPKLVRSTRYDCSPIVGEASNLACEDKLTTEYRI